MERYITSGVNSNINIFLQQAIFDALNKVDKELDYLQIFNLKRYENLTTIEGIVATMILSEEY